MSKYVQTAGKTILLSLSGALLFALAGCKVPEPIVAAHMKRPTAQVVGAHALDGDPVTRKSDTGIYPNFAQPLTAAGSQMTDDEASKMETNLLCLRATKRNGHLSEAEYKRRVAELRALAEK